MDRTTAVTFDLDGVLVDSFETVGEAFRSAYEAIGGKGEAPLAQYRDLPGHSFKNALALLGLPQEMEEHFVRESIGLRNHVVLQPGVERILMDLHERDFGLAVATSKRGENARGLLEYLGILDYFECVLGADEVARPKPAGDIILEALRILGASPNQAVMVGDAVVDLTSARAAGVGAVAVTWGETPRADLIKAGPDAVLSSPDELLELLPKQAHKPRH